MDHSNPKPFKIILPSELPGSKEGHFGNLIFLTQTDTTMGFVSQDAMRLNKIKQRPPHKHFIRALPSLKSLNSYTRTPQMHKNRLRRATKSTFIFPDKNSYRIIRDTNHHDLLAKLGWAYTTSANLSGQAYNADFAKEAADVIVGFPVKKGDQKASRIFKLGRISLRRIR